MDQNPTAEQVRDDCLSAAEKASGPQGCQVGHQAAARQGSKEATDTSQTA